MVEIKNELSVEEYNALRKSIGWDIKDVHMERVRKYSFFLFL